jgi:hypothetical protein
MLGGPVSTIPTDAGPPSAVPGGSPQTVHVSCEACDEHLLVAVPKTSARYAAFDCPGCGSGYVVRVGPRLGRSREPS